MAKQTVKLTFAMWEYRAEMTVEVGGNCTGLRVISTAVSIAYEQLPLGSDGMGSHDIPLFSMSAPSGDILQCTDDDNQCECWLEDMLICAEIISIEPTPRL